MRLVAVTTLLLLGTALLPGAPAANECTGTTCQTIVVPANAPQAGGKTYYLYLKSLTCNPPADGECADQPRALLFGVLYEEANCAGGLQRFPGTSCGGATDKLVLL